MFEDTKGVIRSRKWKKEKNNTMVKRKRTKGQATIYKTLHITLKAEQHDVTTANTKCTMNNVP